ncbi:MAG TPA: hypothetical protein VLD35_15060 [Caldimonas sp.]|nr:hypothetical protein [Caldimonas sp.]
MGFSHVLPLVLLCLAAAPAMAVESCELNGQHVNPNNGNTTAGKTGLMRCRDGEGGPVVREQELQGGMFKGAVRFFRDGQLEKDYRVNERGNRDGVAGERGGRVVTLDQEYHESGKLVRERRWRLVDRGGEPASEQHWYLNGQPKERVDYAVVDGRSLRQETTYQDNGQKAFEGAWRVATPVSRGGEAATGVHRRFDEAGRLRGERFHDERGRVTRERELDGSGSVVRDDEVFEDGSRKAYGK